MTSIKPTRTELIDMIIRKVHSEMVNERHAVQKEYQQISQDQARLEEDRSTKRIGFEEQRQALEADINEVLARHGLSETEIYVDSSKERNNDGYTGKVIPRFHINPVYGKAKRPKSTKVLDRKIQALDRKKTKCRGQINTLNHKIRSFDLDDRYSDFKPSQIRSKAIQIICESNDAVVKAVSEAAKTITDKDPTELMEAIYSRD